MYYLYVLLVIIFAIILYKLSINMENFIDMGPRHAKLNDFDGVMYVDRMPPPWRINDNSCFEYPCPAVFEKDVVCWKCMWREAEPQNE